MNHTIKCDSCCCCCCSNRSSKVAPENNLSESDVETNSSERINGWSSPLHPLQVMAWLFILIFGVIHFGILVTYLPRAWKAAGIIVPACLLTVHIVYHIMCLSVDPSDPAVKTKRHKSKHPGKANFDRTKRAHVIENFHCCICLTQVGEKSKHCSVCNKCVADFDHHCKWLNNCVGGQNYRLFLGCIIAAFFCCVVIFAIDLYQLVLYFVDQNSLLTNQGTNWRLFISVPKEAYLATVSVTAILLLISLGLLGHLIVFHFYLIFQNMSTYEYIVRLRDKHLRTNKSDVESGEISPPKIEPIKGGTIKGETKDIGFSGNEKLRTRPTQQGKNSSSSPSEIANDFDKPSSDLENAGATIKLNGANSQLTENGTFEESSDDQVEMERLKNRCGEETPPLGKKDADLKSEKELGSIESLYEIKESKLRNIVGNNNQLKSNGEVMRESLIHNEQENVESNLLRNSESEKEIDIKEKYKKKKIKKRKVKRRLSKELPPVLVKPKRPLPKLAAVDEEIEQGAEA